MTEKPILAVDFDGVIHSYRSGWKGATVIPDPPVNGAFIFLCDAVKHFRVVIVSSRLNEPAGISAVRNWLRDMMCVSDNGKRAFDLIEYDTHRPAAFVTLDDRAVTFDGVFPEAESLLSFRPWHKRVAQQTIKGALEEDRQRVIDVVNAWLDSNRVDVQAGAIHDLHEMIRSKWVMRDG